MLQRSRRIHLVRCHFKGVAVIDDGILPIMLHVAVKPGVQVETAKREVTVRRVP